jgi:hypothetical protein
MAVGTQYLKSFSFDRYEIDSYYSGGWYQAFFNMVRESGLSKHLELKNVKVCYIDLNTFNPWINDHNTNIRNESFKILFDNNFKNNDPSEYKFLISFLGEAKNHLEVIPLLDLLKINGVPTNRIYILNSSKTEPLKEYRSENFWEYFLRNPFGTGDFDTYVDQSTNLPEYNHRDTTPTKHFLCLMRRARIDRMFFFGELTEYPWWNNKKVIDLSLGSFGEDATYYFGNYENYFKPGIMEKLPITWDTFPIDDNIQHVFLTNNNITQLANIVVESIIITNDLTFNRLFVTEKSMKPFYYYQMPIFMGQKGLVKLIRDLGFDVFDDYFENHYYDEIESDYLRMKEVLTVADNFFKKNPHYRLPMIKKNIITRLDNNLNTARTFSETKYHKTFFEKVCKLLEI